MELLVLGGTGLLGIALCREARSRKIDVGNAARKSADIDLDLNDPDSLESLLDKHNPEMVINAAALVDLSACENDPALAMQINAQPARVLAKWSKVTGRPFVHISTDHFFDGDDRMQHDENAQTTICNVYAKSKLAAESYALKAEKALVLRTSLVGIHPDERGFVGWVFDALTHHKPLTLFDDFFSSSIDTHTFATATFDLMARKEYGLLNLASAQVSSKKEFIHALAAAIDIDLNWAETASVAAITPRRARSLGLDVRKVEAVLGRAMPQLQGVVTQITAQWKAANEWKMAS
ncbi:MAG: NAD(P)-dependent oxidoreductase [Robiginitomaculum sp.]|nr:MAG: NAD(P)-dependent oxidoreductase [Robiginitomaculum sp.]